MQQSTTDIRTPILQFFRETLQIEVADDTEDLLHTGRLDSLGLVELLFFLERRFGIQMDLERLDLDELRTIERICRMIEDQASRC